MERKREVRARKRHEKTLKGLNFNVVIFALSDPNIAQEDGVV